MGGADRQSINRRRPREEVQQEGMGGSGVSHPASPGVRVKVTLHRSKRRKKKNNLEAKGSQDNSSLEKLVRN